MGLTPPPPQPQPPGPAVDPLDPQLTAMICMSPYKSPLPRAIEVDVGVGFEGGG